MNSLSWASNTKILFHMHLLTYDKQCKYITEKIRYFQIYTYEIRNKKYIKKFLVAKRHLLSLIDDGDTIVNNLMKWVKCDSQTLCGKYGLRNTTINTCTYRMVVACPNLIYKLWGKKPISLWFSSA